MRAILWACSVLCVVVGGGVSIHDDVAGKLVLCGKTGFCFAGIIGPIESSVPPSSFLSRSVSRARLL